MTIYMNTTNLWKSRIRREKYHEAAQTVYIVQFSANIPQCFIASMSSCKRYQRRIQFLYCIKLFLFCISTTDILKEKKKAKIKSSTMTKCDQSENIPYLFHPPQLQPQQLFSHSDIRHQEVCPFYSNTLFVNLCTLLHALLWL